MVSFSFFNIFKYSKLKEVESEKIKESLFKGYAWFSKYFQKIVSFEDIKYSFTEMFKIYVIVKVINIINDKFILFITTNVVIFYSPIEDMTDHFLFKAKTAVEQTIEGIFGILSCFIPKYVEPKKENKE